MEPVSRGSRLPARSRESGLPGEDSISSHHWSRQKIVLTPCYIESYGGYIFRQSVLRNGLATIGRGALSDQLDDRALHLVADPVGPVLRAGHFLRPPFGVLGPPPRFAWSGLWWVPARSASVVHGAPS